MGLKRLALGTAVTALIVVSSTLVARHYVDAQSSQVPGPLYSYAIATAGTIPEYVTPQGGVPILGASGLVDTGTELQYQGKPVSTAATPLLTWYGAFQGTFGGLTNVSLGSVWVPGASITVERFDFTVGTAAAACTTSPVIGLYDETTSTYIVSETVSNGTFGFVNAVSPAVVIPANHRLQLGVKTAGVGCTASTPQSAQITVEYTMS